MSSLLSSILICNLLACNFSNNSIFESFTKEKVGQYSVRTNKKNVVCTLGVRDSRIKGLMIWREIKGGTLLTIQTCKNLYPKIFGCKHSVMVDTVFSLICMAGIENTTKQQVAL